MLATRALSIDFVSGLIRIGSDAGPEGPPRCPLVRCLGPALDMAYGLEHVSLLPDEIRTLVDRLLAGPLGEAHTPHEAFPDGVLLEPV